MIQDFNAFSQADIPFITLCNPNKEELYAISRIIFDTKLNLRFNALSEFTFKMAKTIDSGKTLVPAYEYLQAKRLVFIEDFGYFIIVKTTEDNDGSTDIITVECQSLEAELNNKRLTSLSGTYKFSGTLNNPGAGKPTETLMELIFKLIPNWTLGYVNTTLAETYRTFEISDTTVYSFLMGDVEKAYQCVFSFDIINRVISADLIGSVTTDTDIFISYDNLIKKSEFSELSDEIVTALWCYGGDGLDVRGVNPTGTNVIYDFSYYKNTKWMSSGLITKLTAWEARFAAALTPYANNLAAIRTKYDEIAAVQVLLDKEQIEYDKNEVLLKTAIEAGQPTDALRAKLQASKVLIDGYNASIKTKNASIATFKAAMVTINNSLSFTNTTYFTAADLKELSSYIIENTYQNENLQLNSFQTSFTPKRDPNPQEIQDAEKALFNQSLVVLAKSAQPRYEFSIDTVNFINIMGFKPFTEDLRLGGKVTIDIKDNWIYTVLLEIELSYDNPENFKLTFSNRLRLDNGRFQYSDLLGQIANTGSSVSFKKINWNNWTDSYKTPVSEFISSALVGTRNKLLSSTNQEIKIDTSGLRGRTVDTTSVTGYKPQEICLTVNVLVFTNDSWKTASLALGQITVAGVTKYGLVADVIVGNLIAGQNLIITNKNPTTGDVTFRVDGNGATITNGTIKVNNSGGAIQIDPANGMFIGKQVGNVFTKTFIADLSGNISMIGKITATTGAIGGWTIDPTGLISSSNYIKSDGNIKLGLLTITPSSATFDGNIYARNLLDRVPDSKIQDMAPNKLLGGTASGVNLSWPGVSLASGGTGNATMNGSSGIEISVGGSNLLLHSGDAYLVGGNTLHLGETGTYTDLNGSNISLNTGNLNLRNVGNIVTPSGDIAFSGFINLGIRTLRVSQGLIYGYS